MTGQFLAPVAGELRVVNVNVKVNGRAEQGHDVANHGRVVATLPATTSPPRCTEGDTMCGRYALALVSVCGANVAVTWLNTRSGRRRCASSSSRRRCPSRTRLATTRCARATTSPRATMGSSTGPTVPATATAGSTTTASKRKQRPSASKVRRATPTPRTSCRPCNGVGPAPTPDGRVLTTPPRARAVLDEAQPGLRQQDEDDQLPRRLARRGPRHVDDDEEEEALRRRGAGLLRVAEEGQPEGAALHQAQGRAAHVPRGALGHGPV
jgi:hypothetical protein